MTTYRDVCEATDEKTCVACFELILDELAAEHGDDRESYRQQQLSNVGYFAGYYSAETARRVMNWLPGCSHPVFGRTRPDAGEAFSAGMNV